MTYNDSNHLVTSKKELFDFFDFEFLIFFFKLFYFTFSSPFPRFFVKLDFLLECFSAKDCFLGASPNRECFRGMTGVCTELRLCSISNAVDDLRPLIVRSVLKTRNSNSKRTAQSSSTDESYPSDFDHILTFETQGLHTLYI